VGTVLVVIPVDLREDAAAAFFRGLEVNLPVGLDADGAPQSARGVVTLPVHFLDRQGCDRPDAALGGIGPDVMAKGLAAILSRVTVTP
jgi:hypothetical protein